MISGHATVQIAVEAIRLGAYEFIEKPFSKEKILNYVNRALESSQLKKEKDIIENKKILDLFSGSGNISFEFSSRANVEITAVDNNINCTEFITKINEELNYNITTFQSDCRNFINNTNEMATIDHDINFFIKNPLIYHYLQIPVAT